MKTKFLRVFSVFLIAALTCVFFLPMREGVASTIAEDQARQKQLESELARIKKDQQKIAADLNEVRSDYNKRKEVVQLLYQEIASCREELNVLSDLILEYTALVDEKKARIEELNAQMEYNYALFKQRLVFAQESGTMSYIDFILGSHDLSDILARGEVINDMLDNDRRIIESLISDRKEVESAKEELEIALNACLEKKEEYDLRAAELEEKVAEAEAYAAELEGDLAAQEAKNAAELAEIAQREQDLAALSEQIKEKQKQQQQAYSGKFIWPLPLSFPGWISRGFTASNPRHTGMDIHVGGWANNGKIPALASAAGTVTRVGKYSDWGNLVVINHGGGYETYYAHLYDGSTKVKVGDYVQQGQEIALIGSTGHSTGPHLHIVFVENGVRVDPARFISHP